MHVPHPEGQPNLSAGSSPEDPAHLELRGELGGEGLLDLLATDEDEGLLAGVAEADVRVRRHRVGLPLSHLMAVNKSPWNRKHTALMIDDNMVLDQYDQKKKRKEKEIISI